MRIAVLGGGALGTSVASLLARQDHSVSLWARDTRQVAEMRSAGQNKRYLAGASLPKALEVTGSLLGALEQAETVVLAVPTPAVPELLDHVRRSLPDGAFILSACKGLFSTGPATPIGRVQQAAPEVDASRLAVLGGPFLANEIAAHLPATLLVAATEEQTARILAEALSNPTTRVVISTDRNGVELLAGLKTAFAVGAGLIEGDGLGESARASLLVALFEEVAALCRALDVRPETLTGLGGLGEIILHGTAPRSRAWQVGYLVGRGTGLEPGLLERPTTTSESVETLQAAATLAREHTIPTPALSAIIDAVSSGRPGIQALHQLLLPQGRA